MNTKIVFPCEYPIKVIGDSAPDFLDNVYTIVCKHDATMTRSKVKERASREGHYTAISLLLWATGEPQLQAMFNELKQYAAVRLVL